MKIYQYLCDFIVVPAPSFASTEYVTRGFDKVEHRSARCSCSNHLMYVKCSYPIRLSVALGAERSSLSSI